MAKPTKEEQAILEELKTYRRRNSADSWPDSIKKLLDFVLGEIIAGRMTENSVKANSLLKVFVKKFEAAGHKPPCRTTFNDYYHKRLAELKDAR